MLTSELFNCFCMFLSVFITSDPPAFTNNYDNVAVYKGNNISLRCDADGFPNPRLTWTCDGIHVQETTNDLLLGQLKHSIRCTCTASNYLHNATKEFNILVHEPSTAVPPAATTPLIAAQQSGTAPLCVLHFHFYSFYPENKSD